MVSDAQRVVVVTGASRGLGLEWVKQLSQDPRNFIIAIVRNPSKADLLSPLLGSRVIAIQGDVANIDSFPSVAKEIAKVCDGKVDLLVNNAGVMHGAGASPSIGISKSTVEDWEQEFRVNVLGLVFFTIALIPLLEMSNEKRVVNVASMLGDLRYTAQFPELHFASYSATKAAVTMANAKFHIEYANKGFIFLALSPGWVNTDLAGKGTGAYAPLQQEESISRCLSFVNRSTIHDSGKFWSLDGSSEPLTK